MLILLIHLFASMVAMVPMPCHTAPRENLAYLGTVVKRVITWFPVVMLKQAADISRLPVLIILHLPQLALLPGSLYVHLLAGTPTLIE